MSNITININPKILRWAREESGYTAQEIASKLDVSTDRYDDWEENGVKIPYGKLKALANYYKRQVAVFFLPSVPEKTKKPRDYRNLSTTSKSFSQKTLLAIRKVSHYQTIASEIKGSSYWVEKNSWLNEITPDISNANLIEWLRYRLNIDLEQQLGWKSEGIAYKSWKQAIEDKLGILIFQFSMPIEEVQGFCLVDHLPYAIVVNSSQPVTARIFTIFHELGHIMRNHSGICIIDSPNQNNAEEYKCNELAGNFLIPEGSITKATNLDSITRFARTFKVSREAYLRRLKEKGFLTNNEFYTLLSQIKATYKSSKKKTGAIAPELKSQASRGATFYNMVLDAANNNRISYTAAADALGLSISRLIKQI